MNAHDTSVVKSVDQLEQHLRRADADLARQGDRPHQRGLSHADRGLAVRGDRDQRAGRARLLAAGRLPGFVRVVDDKTLMIPDRRGNNRLDGFQN